MEGLSGEECESAGGVVLCVGRERFWVEKRLCAVHDEGIGYFCE